MTKSSLTSWTIRILLLVVIGAGLYFAHRFTLEFKRQQLEVAAAQEAAPRLEAAEAGLAADLKQHEFDISRIDRLLVARSDIAQVAGAIEAAATQRGITAQIPEIDEDSDEEDQDKQPNEGAVIEVKLTITFSGDPAATIAFLHQVENLPYALHLDSLAWRNRPPVIPSASPLPEQPVPAALGNGEVTVILLVRNDSNV